MITLHRLSSELGTRWRSLRLSAEEFSARVVTYRAARRILRLSRLLSDEIRVTLFSPSIDDSVLQEALVAGLFLFQLPEQIRSSAGVGLFIDPSQKDERVAFLCQIAREAPDIIVTQSNRICEHVFDLLGSGPKLLGEKIDWHVDFKTGHRWNPKTYYRHIRRALHPGGHDIKVPWELSRCQHFTRLGQAYWMTGDEKYAQEFVAQIEDWIESNPWPFGVNWACTMDVAIRVVNWLWGLAFFSDSVSVTDEFLVELARSLLVHGRHIMGNLEGSRENRHTNNHYLSNIVGLVYLGICCRFFKEAERWLRFATEELWNEVFKQVYPDGVDFEASISYHRLVTELFLSPIILCQLNDIPVPNEVMEWLEKMIEFVMYYTKPDGRVPLIGDADNGRLQRLKVWAEPEREWIDHRYLLAIGAVLFQRDDFAQAAGEQWEEAFWLLGERAIAYKEQFHRDNQPLLFLKSQCFPDGGLYIMRHDDLYMIIDAGDNGQKGHGGHAHNDTLSFELCAGGRTFISDSGTYVYTTDYRERNRFRSTAYHNTVMVDGQEISRFEERVLFQMIDNVQPHVHTWETTDTYDLFDAEHDGYTRLADPIVHRRQVYFDKVTSLWLVRDLLLGTGQHQFDWFWHFSPAPVGLERNNAFTSWSEGSNLTVVLVDPPDIESRLEQGWVSYSYGQRQTAPVLHYMLIAEAPVELVTAFVVLEQGRKLSRFQIDASLSQFKSLTDESK